MPHCQAKYSNDLGNGHVELEEVYAENGLFLYPLHWAGDGRAPLRVLSIRCSPSMVSSGGRL